MTELQSKLLENFKEFDCFCRKNKINYYMLGGTMLGSYRHQGFIPWDDDIDVGIPRRDYERFLKLAQEKYSDHYVLRNRKVQKNTPFAFSHMEDKRTTCIEHRRCKDTYIGGVYLEIFPLDGCANASWKQKVQAFFVYLYKKILYALIMDYEQKHRVFYKAILIKGIRRLFRIEQLTKRLDCCIKTYDLEKSKYICNHLGHWGRKENIPKIYFQPPVEYPFEDGIFLGVKEPEKYLTFLYGENYMTLPSLEEQKMAQHPAFYLNLKLPFEEYKKNRNKENES